MIRFLLQRGTMKQKLRAVYFCYLFISLSAFYSALPVGAINPVIDSVTDWDWVYPWLLGSSILIILHGIWRPFIGQITLTIAPLAFVSVIRLLDFAQNLLFDKNPLASIDIYVRGSIGWLAIVVSTVAIAILEWYIVRGLKGLENGQRSSN